MKYLLCLCMLLGAGSTMAQVVCNPNGNLLLYTNYDGGQLNIVIDENVPNIRIGIVSYEAVQINLSGPYVNNVIAVHYAGYNSNNNNCAVNIPTTVFSGVPAAATTAIQFAPPATLTNPFGYNSIICAYSCNTNTNQGGCNTVDQIEAFFAGTFPGSTLRFHRVQYNCWSGTQTMSNAGTCCANPALPLSVSAVGNSPTCHNMCNGTVTASASGGQSPYLIQWSGGPSTATWSNRCSGTYTVTVTDASNTSASSIVTLNNPAPITNTIATTACKEHVFNGQLIKQSGAYSDTLVAANGCDSLLTLNLTIQNVDTAVTLNGITATANATNASYQWINCVNQTNVNGANTQSFTAPWTGSWAVIITQNNCTDTSRCLMFGPNSVGDISKETYVIYPNPGDGLFTIEWPGKQESYDIIMKDILGKDVYKTKGKGSKIPLNVKHLPTGTYFLHLGQSNKVMRLIIQ